MCLDCRCNVDDDRALRRQCPSKIKRQILERDGHKCVKCGSKWRPCVDHIVSIAAGGTSDPSNLQTLCRSCNTAKRDHDDVPEHLIIRRDR
jgi:5-methylcytosine-specific restriction endonuclease McrA